MGKAGWTQNGPCIHCIPGSGVTASPAIQNVGYARRARLAEYVAAPLDHFASDYGRVDFRSDTVEIILALFVPKAAVNQHDRPIAPKRVLTLLSA